MSPNLTINSKYHLPSGYDIPVLGYGVYLTPVGKAKTVVEYAFQTGYRHVDSAAVYKNEAEAAQGMLASGVPRDQMFFTSKIPPGQISYEGAKRNVEQSLKHINPSGAKGLGYIDLMLLHAPFGGTEARLGAWKALVEAVEEGKIRSIGVSNYGVKHLDELEQWIKKTEASKGKGKGGVLSINQIELHPWLTHPDIVDWCEKRGVLLEAYSPLARAKRLNEPVLHEIGKQYSKSPAQVLIRWSLQKGFVPLPKSVTPQRIEENANIYDFQLSDSDMKKLDIDAYEPSAPGWDPTKEP